MRILYLSQYFPPEAGATQTRAYEMARTFVCLGHAVTILAEIPNHPSGIIPPAYRGKWFEHVDLDGIDVIRVWVKASPNKNFRSRMLFYLSYMFTSFFAGAFGVHGHFDLIYSSSPPLFVGIAGLALSYIKHRPFFFEVRDLWPESAIVLGELSNPHYIHWAEQVETACYRQARKIIVVTRGIQDRLLERNIPPEKLIFIPNGANIQNFHYDPIGRYDLRSELGWQDCFIAIYAGIFGLAQGFETVLQAAQLLSHHPTIRIILVGDGPAKDMIVKEAQRMNLSNLRIIPEQPRERIPAYLSAADVAIVPLRKLELFKGALPSKIFDAWACDRPVLISIDGEARQVVESAQGGHFIEPEDPQALAEALINLSTNRSECNRMGVNGRIFTAANYSRPVLAEQLCNILQNELENIR